MSLSGQDNKGLAVIYEDKSKKMLAKAEIMNYDRIRHVITVDASHFQSDDSIRVSLLIIEKESLKECLGTLRRHDGSRHREIAIYNIKAKESRGCTRYALDTEAIVDNLKIDGISPALEETLTVRVENISGNGILISTPSTLFNINSTFRLKLSMGSGEIILNTTVVRISEERDGSRKLGCKFLSSLH